MAGLIGTILIFVTGIMFGEFFPILSGVVVPFLVQQAPDIFKGQGPPAFLPFFIVANLAFVAGSILLAIPMLRGLVYARWPGYLLIAVAVFGVVGFAVGFAVGNGPSSNAFVGVLGNIAPLILFVVLAWLGYALWSERADVAPEPQAARRPTPAG